MVGVFLHLCKYFAFIVISLNKSLCYLITEIRVQVIINGSCFMDTVKHVIFEMLNVPYCPSI